MNEQNRIVSSEDEELILVDRDNNEVGYLSKALCHDGPGILHRAFSLFLFNDEGELLLQKRGQGKRLWPGYWSNSCCSHPRRGESMEIATMRRLNDELNIEASLEYVYKFCYTAEFSEAGSENELCHVYLGNVTGNLRPNDSEIANIRFASAHSLGEELIRSPQQFTPWFKQEWLELVENHREQLINYCDLS
jgi:isopentenyl-diphosphate delta-isomerase